MSRPSYEVIKRYRDKAIKRIAIDLRKDLVDTCGKLRLQKTAFPKLNLFATLLLNI